MSETRLPQFGVAIINGNLESSGIYGLSGCQSQRFNHVDDLLMNFPGVTWITSLQPQVFMNNGNKKTWLRPTNFFPTSVTHLIEEIGVAPSDINYAAQVISEVIDRTVLRGEENSSSIIDPKKCAEFSDYFNESYGVSNIPYHDSINVSDFMRQASLITQVATDTASANDTIIRLPMQRIPHYKSVTNQEVPSGVWHEINLSTKQDPLEWVLSSPLPVLAYITVNKVNDGLNILGSHLLRGRKSWVALPELMTIKQIADVNVERAFCAEEQISMASVLARPLPKIEPMEYMSISSGLCMESLLASLSRASNSPSVNVTGPSVWMLAHAKARVLSEAVILSRSGFKVIAQGFSHLTVAVKRKDIPRLREVIAVSENLLLPAKFSRKWKGDKCRRSF